MPTVIKLLSTGNNIRSGSGSDKPGWNVNNAVNAAPSQYLFSKIMISPPKYCRQICQGQHFSFMTHRYYDGIIGSNRHNRCAPIMAIHGLIRSTSARK